MSALPPYDDLPAAPQGGRSAWGVFGVEDNVGLVNLQGAEQVLRGSRLVRRGRVFRLDAALDFFDPPLAGHRGLLRATVLHENGQLAFDDVIDNFYPQASSQWDSLGHVGYASDSFYNGASEDDIRCGRRNGIEHWARKGIVGRGVVLDVARARAEAGRPYSPGDPVAFDVDDLELARRRAGVEYEAGDVILLHTGFAAWYAGLSIRDRRALRRRLTAPGIAHTEDMARYLWNSHASALGSDTFAVEVWPADHGSEPFGFLHRLLIGQFGMALGELWWLADLADDCAEDGVHECFFVSAPLYLPGGIGSPPNATAIK